ncbi:MAG: acyl-CoA dehydrogenase family protein [Anaerolineales bacterium]|nr:acyl-CoA dehydrogenase family protein [Anaerolineales bacterium]
MYSFEPNDEQKMLIDAVTRYAENDLRPSAREAEESGELPGNLIKKGWELGVLQASVPEEYGGFGEHSAVTGVLAAEAMAWGDLAGTLAVMAPSTYVMPILIGGTQEQKEKLIAPVIEAEWKPYVGAYIEPNYDFYPLEMRTKAVRKNGSYVINGEKTFVPFANAAPSLLVFADLEGTTQAFVVPADAEGLTVGEREKWLGVNALPTYSLKFDDLEVPAENRIGGDEGFDPAAIFASANTAIASMAIGVSQAALDYALPYAKEREVWGVPIAQKQSIAFMLAEMAIEIESNRLLVWEAAWKLDQGNDAAREAYLALNGTSDTAMMTTDRAVQILGGYGYIREYPVELWMRNGRGIAAFAGLAMV